jgi:hypothetical protein
MVDEMKSILVTTKDSISFKQKVDQIFLNRKVRKSFLIVSFLMTLLPFTGGTIISFAILATLARCFGSGLSGFVLFRLGTRSTLLLSSFAVALFAVLTSAVLTTRNYLPADNDDVLSFLISVKTFK